MSNLIDFSHYVPTELFDSADVGLLHNKTKEQLEQMVLDGLLTKRERAVTIQEKNRDMDVDDDDDNGENGCSSSTGNAAAAAPKTSATGNAAAAEKISARDEYLIDRTLDAVREAGERRGRSRDRDSDESEEEDEEEKKKSGKDGSRASSRASSRDSKEDKKKNKPTKGQKGRTSNVRKDVQLLVRAIAGDLNTGATESIIIAKYSSVINQKYALSDVPTVLGDAIKLKGAGVCDTERLEMNEFILDLRKEATSTKFIDSLPTMDKKGLENNLDRLEVELMQAERQVKKLKSYKKLINYYYDKTNSDEQALTILVELLTKKLTMGF